jgi:Uma2 family endonuclease
MTIAIDKSAQYEKSKTAPETFYRISVEHYHQMIAAGIFDEDDAVELLEGQIVNKMPKSRAHSIVTNLIIQALQQLIAASHHIESQEPITLETSEPEPDVVVLRGQILDYQEHPQAQDVSLLVEVSDSSLQRDQTWKKQVYAEAEIPVYWIVNLPDRQIEVYSDPTGPSHNPNYRQLLSYGESDEIPVVIHGQEIGILTVESLLAAL